MADPSSRQSSSAARREAWRFLSLSTPSLVLATVLLLLPVGWLFWLSFFQAGEPTFQHYIRLVEQPSYVRIFVTTFQLAFVVTVICALLGYPLAYTLSLLPKRWATLGLMLVMIPFWTALLVRTYAWLVLLQRGGIINSTLIGAGWIDAPLPLAYNMTGTTIGMVHIMLPYFVLPLYANMRSIDRSVMQAAASLGASPTTAFRRVYLPASAPGLTTGAILVFVICLGFYVVPQFLGGGKVTTISMKIQQNVSDYFDWGAASALGVVLLIITGVLLLVARLVSPNRSLGGTGV